MRIAALYDIHGNLPALDAVLEEVVRESVDLIVVGGDVVPGPMPLECLARLRDFPARFIRGNGEVAVLTQAAGDDPGVPAQAREAVRWTAEELSPSDIEFLASWPKTLQLEIDGLGPVLFCHGTPRDENESFTRLTSEERLLPAFADVHAALVICGHTHMQFDRMIGNVRVVNAGSVGMPFGKPGADWLLLADEIELRHTVYDFEDAAERVRRTRYPQADDFAARNILWPPAEEEMLALFTNLENARQ